jgi:homoserine dehydrogenase
MSAGTPLTIGLFGFGCVGQGLYDVLTNATGLEARIVRVCVKDRLKTRPLESKLFTFDRYDILDDPSINLVVELIDDADEAFKIVSLAMQRGKSVVTSNKKMVAEHFEQLYQIQQQTGQPLLYEGSSCGSIPIIRTLEEYYDNELLKSVTGIFNGTTNYILTKVMDEALDYPTALKQAQRLGFAESNPFLDVSGQDARYKLCILAAHAYGIIVRPESVFVYGISTLGLADQQFAREKGYKIKLMAQSRETEHGLVLSVMPHFVKPDSFQAKVNNEYNCVMVEAVFSDTQYYQGKGAGSHPTGSAVLSDVSACRYGYRYEYRKLQRENKPTYTQNIQLTVYLRYRTDEDLKRFEFDAITAYHANYEQGYCYVLGSIRLSALAAVHGLEELDVFLAVLPE